MVDGWCGITVCKGGTCCVTRFGGWLCARAGLVGRHFLLVMVLMSFPNWGVIVSFYGSCGISFFGLSYPRLCWCAG